MELEEDYVYVDHTFSLRDKTQKQIELEDWATWARKPIELPDPVMLRKELSVKWKFSLVYVFIRGVKIFSL